MFWGIQDQRSSRTSSYSGIIVTIILSYALLASCKWLGQEGVTPAALAGWIPPVLSLLVAMMLLLRRNRIPFSESIFKR